MVTDVAAALAASGLPASALVLEITETALMQDVDATVIRVAEIKALGVRVAVDDFGTGFSSLSYLGRLARHPQDRQVLYRGLGQDTDQFNIVRALVELGASLGLEIVAEGIEEPVQFEQLRAMRSRPRPGLLLCPASRRRRADRAAGDIRSGLHHGADP